MGRLTSGGPATFSMTKPAGRWKVRLSMVMSAAKAGSVAMSKRVQRRQKVMSALRVEVCGRIERWNWSAGKRWHGRQNGVHGLQDEAGGDHGDAAGERVGGVDCDWSDRSGWGSASVMARYGYGAAGLPWAVRSVANVVTLPSGPIFLTRGSHCSRLAECGGWYSKTLTS